MERFKSPCLPPTGLRQELLEILAEECAEVIQRTTKALRFGLDEIQPGQEYNNAERISLEVGDLYEVLNRLTAMNIVRNRFVLIGQRRKEKQLAEFLQNDE